MRRPLLIPLAAAPALLLALAALHRVLAPPTIPPKATAGGAIIVTDTTAYTTRPLRRDEADKPLLPVALPADATDVQFAEYAEWQAYEMFITFRAPPTTCLAYASAVLTEFNRSNPDRRVPANLTPIARRPADDLRPVFSRTLPVAWFTPQAITTGVEGGEDGSHQPKVWVDTSAGTFYYRFTD